MVFWLRNTGSPKSQIKDLKYLRKTIKKYEYPNFQIKK